MDSTREQMINNQNYPNVEQVPNQQGYQTSNTPYKPYPQNQSNGQQNNYPSQQHNQGYGPNYPQGQQPNMGQQPYMGQQYPQQGYQPYGQNQMPPPPPMVNQQIMVRLPPLITTAHPYYNAILDKCSIPCSVCSFSGGEIVSLVPGCALYSWSACLYFFTGFLCFWIPFVVSDCKDIRISCSRCGNLKAIIERPCC